MGLHISLLENQNKSWGSTPKTPTEICLLTYMLYWCYISSKFFSSDPITLLPDTHIVVGTTGQCCVTRPLFLMQISNFTMVQSAPKSAHKEMKIFFVQNAGKPQTFQYTVYRK